MVSGLKRSVLRARGVAAVRCTATPRSDGNGPHNGPHACAPHVSAERGSAHPWRRALSLAVAGGLSLQLLLLAPSASLAALAPAEPDIDTFENVPSQLSAQGEVKDVPLSSVVSGPKKKEIESCTRKCVPTCARGGDGAPGLGPISVRKEIVVFKEGFRSRQYCLSECAQVCALSYDRDKAVLLAPQIEAAAARAGLQQQPSSSPPAGAAATASGTAVSEVQGGSR
ncbi:hypothetical protein HYH02_015072 [Chlamydomonas schloesseri]|uniref:Uncharacterized protein n=1 Tax=Chlamydomonas schloesseri TaxID=2026947 RepID=A0A835VTC4_9CHLO|nr:hypothetical protein HYH02_015072 [Chlamydomonas schloesseri]|eukprot:KAG2425128.1 hypothetical protein HYH02_015072 [Chlamydomonas schloesseri]